MAAVPNMTIEQTRAAFAYQRVVAHASDASRAKEYKAVAKGAPALVMSNGLIQSLLYLQDKGGASKALCEDVLQWLAKRSLVSSNNFSEQVRNLTGLDSEQYLRATQESIEMLKWIKQFASALL